MKKQEWNAVKRAAIFVFYDREGVVEPCVVQMLKQIKSYVIKLIVVCNGHLTEDGYQILRMTADEIVLRDNVGYDAGAYKDVILQMHERNQMQEYDELILMNDSFFGFFYSLDDFFKTVHQNEKVDFWGFTKHPKGEDKQGNKFDEHIQTYFLLINENMLHSKIFLTYWQKLPYPESFRAAIMNFEKKFTTWFEQRGFLGEAYYDLKKLGINVKYNLNPYTNYTYELIAELKCPVLKKKSVWIEFQKNMSAFKALDYLKRNHLLEIDSIWEYLIHKCQNGSIAPYYDFYQLECFCKQYPSLYIYGAGKHGKQMKSYLEIRGFSFEKFIVTHKDTSKESGSIELGDLEVKADTGIILALNEEHTKQVLGNVLAIVNKKQVFCGRQQGGGK